MNRTIGSVALVALALVVSACTSPGLRQQEVARRGAAVMPFDLEATTHRFVPVDDGLVQTVVADDPHDVTQVRLVRRHLRSEARRFHAGDFDDPAAIHGDEMPGLAKLRAHNGAVSVDYRSVSGGGEILYRSTDAELVGALHAWGEAQSSDHGSHAE